MFAYYFLILFWCVVGLRFHDLKVTPSDAEVVKTLYTHVNGKDIEILFYRETYYETVYRFGFFLSKKTVSFIVEGIFEQIPPNNIQRFNRRRYIFDSWWFSKLNDKIIASVLTTIYMDYLAYELSGNQ